MLGILWNIFLKNKKTQSVPVDDEVQDAIMHKADSKIVPNKKTRSPLYKLFSR
jgi:hypothetical protein